MHAYEIRPRKDKRGFDLISDALPFGAPVQGTKIVDAATPSSLIAANGGRN
jgi:hypothetical protein